MVPQATAKPMRINSKWVSKHKPWWAILLLLLGLYPSQGAAQEIAFGDATLELPAGWSVEQESTGEIAQMPTYHLALSSADGRVRVLLLMLTPFGLDIEGWGPSELLGGALIDELAAQGAPSDEMRLRPTTCMMAGKENEGRLVVYPWVSTGKLLSGMACSVQEVDRWVFALTIVESPFTRPLTLVKAMREADLMLSTLSY